MRGANNMPDPSMEAFANLLGKIVATNPRIATPKPKDVSYEGDVRFRLTAKELGVTRDELRACSRLLFTPCTANFLGEWFVRQNLPVFNALVGAPLLTEARKSASHGRFGMTWVDVTSIHIGLEFCFHISLLDRLTDAARPAEPESKPAKAKPSPGSGDATPASDEFRLWIERLPLMTPEAMFDKLGTLGYVGQEEARHAVCLMACRHIKRLKRIHLQQIARTDMPPKDNLLLMGPTGCGKTHLVELLFNKVLRIPTVVVDITTFTEAGYVGDEVQDILTRLLEAAGGRAEMASAGIVCIDEFDKIAGNFSNRGSARSKDVTGAGVQRELLKMFEDSQVSVRTRQSHAVDIPRVGMRTGDIPFIACGAFSGFASTSAARRAMRSIGFNTPAATADASREEMTQADVATAESFSAYGIMPELMGRFSRIVPFKGIGPSELRTILKESVVAQYRKELELDGIGLQVADAVLDRVVSECQSCGTGARGLRALLVKALEAACFKAYSSASQDRCVNVVMEEDQIVSSLKDHASAEATEEAAT
ncbi:MAG: AAA family ATPase [Lysobacterales bacterium]|nr:MAG: AAA family ATPase [Xanthomonadales bacterium]